MIYERAYTTRQNIAPGAEEQSDNKQTYRCQDSFAYDRIFGGKGNLALGLSALLSYKAQITR